MSEPQSQNYAKICVRLGCPGVGRLPTDKKRPKDPQGKPYPVVCGYLTAGLDCAHPKYREAWRQIKKRLEDTDATTT